MCPKFFTKRILHITAAIAAILVISAIVSCGGGGGGGGGGESSNNTSNKVTLSGTLSDNSSASKPDDDAYDYPLSYKVSDWSGTKVEIISSSGDVISETTANSDGSYSISIDPGSNYVVRASKGNLVLKAIVDSAASSKTVNVNPSSTAIVKVIAQILGNTNFGEKGQNLASQIAARNISNDISSITSHSNFTSLVSSIAQEIETKYDPNAATVSIGAVSTTGNTDASTIASTTTGTIITGSAPSAPTGVTATAGNGQVTISWTAVTDATSYNIYWATTTGVTKTSGTKITGATSPYTHTSLTNGSTYYYVVTAVNSIGESSESSEVSATPSSSTSVPSAPTGVSATAGNGQVTISWTAVTGATSYNIYWSTTSGVTKTSGTKITGATSPYTHTGLTNGTTYYYVVTAVNSIGESSESSQVSATPTSGTSQQWSMLKLPDTGQTGNYTSTFGEDSDYTINSPSYTDNGNGTITDNVTGLIWQKEDDNTTRTWDNAGTYCDSLTLGSYSDWRLPSDMELMSIVNYGTYKPTINTTYFPNTNSSFYWSSTTGADDSSHAWSVHFSYGYVIYGYKSDGSYYVRCVRAGQ